MSYIINNSRGNIVAVITDGTVNTTSTPISLVGRGVVDFGTAENENYVWILENFAKPTAPPNAILGQLWYNNDENVLAVYNPASTWTNLASTDYVDAQKISPVFSGIPAAPTAAAGVNTTQIATTAFVASAVGILGGSTAASLNLKANIASPNLTGVPTAPTAAAGTSTEQIATTAFVTTGPVFLGVPTAPTATSTDDSTQLATTAFVQAQKFSPVFVGFPTAPTTSADDNTTQLATTAFVQLQKNNIVLTGVPVAPTASASTSTTQMATTAFVQAQKISPAFTGVPTAPTAALATSTTQIATTAFVSLALNTVSANLGTIATQNANAVSITGGSILGIDALSVSVGGTGAAIPSAARTNLGLGSMAVQNAGNVAITGGAISGIVPLAVADGGTGVTTSTGTGNAVLSVSPVISSPALTGTPTVPTATFGNNTTQAASTAFVQAALTAILPVVYPVGSLYSSTNSSDPAVLFGFGTWTAYSAGRVLIGAGGEFLAGTIGGSANSVVVEHLHYGTTNFAGSHAHGYDDAYFAEISPPWRVYGTAARTDNDNGYYYRTPRPTTDFNGNHFHDFTTDTAGSSGTNANLQPYVVVYMWLRVA